MQKFLIFYFLNYLYLCIIILKQLKNHVMLVKNLFYQVSIAVVLGLSTLLFYQCTPATCNLPAPTLSTSNITTNAAKVSWGTFNTAPADDYQVELIDANTNSVISTVFTSNTDFTFANLAANKAYSVRVTPRCDVSTASSNQSSLNFSTLNASLVCNLPAPALLTIVPSSATTANLSWEPVQTAVSYRVTVFDSTANTTRIFNITPPPAMTLDSLVAGHKYSIKVAAVCANGEVSPNLITRDFKPFIIEDDMVMFNGKTISTNCNMNNPTISIPSGQRINISLTSGNSNLLIRATDGSTNTDIRVIYEKMGEKILVSAGLNCLDYEYDSAKNRSENVVTKTVSGGALEVELFYDYVVVMFPPTVTVKYQQLP